ncbi:unnamed protein product [Microthlaspi erraticum]|uniref:Uncharacterized protein n=1 Tax=Microthlaspi erraticum TaxID=1685480 RepID=A0A6D2IJ77_9BRAS|nr:unnamed protein product [Microthlaspi erraticum]
MSISCKIGQSFPTIFNCCPSIFSLTSYELYHANFLVTVSLRVKHNGLVAADHNHWWFHAHGLRHHRLRVHVPGFPPTRLATSGLPEST